MKNATLFKTTNSYAPLIERILLAAVLFPHGAQKLLGWYGGYGFEGTMGYFTQTVHLPWIIGFIVILIEFFGPLVLLAGFATRVTSALIAILAVGIVLSTRLPYGFFMNWFGNQKGEGYEYFLLLFAIAVSLAIRGGGKWSIDYRLT